MTLNEILSSTLFAHPFLTLLLIPVTTLIIRSLYRISPFHPLSHLPGDYLPWLSSLWLVYHAWTGDESTVVHRLHEKHGHIVRTGPMSVDMADGEALQTIYVEKGGFRKPDFYGNFDIDGHKSIFSEIDASRRAPRAKAVAPMFSTANLRQGRTCIYACVDNWIAKMRRQAGSGRAVNVLDLCRALAVDAVSSYLFGTCYGGLDSTTSQTEDAKKESEEESLTAAGMVNSFVAVGRYWYLPGWAFNWLAAAEEKLYADRDALTSIGIVDEFVDKVVMQTISEKETKSYPGRLLQAGFSESETKAQCKDLMFAGTDSTGMNLATIVFMLAKHPGKYERLRNEVLTAKPREDEVQSLPYLRGVIQEGLRMSMANPSRLPRVVPPGGWNFKGTYLPNGTEVSCTPYELHFNEAVFPNAREFRPERWLADEVTDEMRRDAIPFGLGSRQCIARNLASMELYCAVQRLAEEDVLRGARCCQDEIEILEWFNSKVTDEKIELVWN